MPVDLNDPSMADYKPLTDFQIGDHDHESTRIRDIPASKPRYGLTMKPEVLTFAGVPAGQVSDPQTVLLINSGYSDLVIDAITTVGAFVISGEVPTKIKPGETASVEIVFEPQASGPDTGAMHVEIEDLVGQSFVKLIGSTSAESFGMISDFVDVNTASGWQIKEAPDFVRTFGYQEPGDLGDGFYRRSEAGERTDLTLTTVGGLSVPYVLKKLLLTPQNCGAIAGSATAQDAAFRRLLRNAVEDNVQAIIQDDFVLDTVNLPAELSATGGILNIRHDGLLTQKNASSADLFAFGTRDAVHFIGSGIIDGQKNGQTANRILIPMGVVKDSSVRGLKFRNVKQGAVHMQNPAADSFIVEGIDCLDGGLHDGILNSQACNFVLVRGGKYARISNSRFVHSVDPIAGQNRNPAGITFINTGAGPAGSKAIVEDCYFENLGHSSAANHLGVVDCYSKIDEIRFSGNTFVKSRFFPIRTNFTKSAKIEKNIIDQAVPMYLNDATLYTDSALFSIGAVNRGYATDGGPVDEVVVSENVGKITGDINCHGISFSNSSADTLFSKAIAEKNVFTNTGTNNNNGIMGNNIREIIANDNDLIGFSHGLRVQQTSNIAPTSAEALARTVVRGGKIKGGLYGVRADLSIANLEVILDGVDFDTQTTAPFRIRGVKKLIVKDCWLPSALPADVSTTVATLFRGNSPLATYPTGFASGTEWDFQGSNLADWRNGDRSGLGLPSVGGNYTWTAGASPNITLFQGAQTVNRTVTLVSTGAMNGITRGRFINNTTGGFTWNIGGLATIAAGQSVEIMWNGTAFVVVG